MAYIGKQPTVGNFQVCDAISVVNGQAAYTLQVGGVNVAPESANHMLVSLNGILQKPGSSFTISGSTMTFASNLATGDVIDFVQILGNVLDIGQPSDDTVGAAQIVDDAISEEHLDVTAITGHTAETSAADADTILIHDDSASALKKMTRSNFLSGVGGVNTPIVFAKLSSSQSISNNTTTDIAFANEIIDTASAFNTSNYTFTVPSDQAGVYMVSIHVRKSDWNTSRFYIDLITSGGNFVFEHGTDSAGAYNTAGGTVLTNLSVGDTVKGRVYHNQGGSQSITNDGTYLSISKLIQ